MTWQFTLYNDYQQSHEACLKLTHCKRSSLLRSWFGPFAQQLFHHIKVKTSSTDATQQSQHIITGKQLTQYILIQASFYHQRCLHQYQVSQDILEKGIPQTQELSDLLLYIRMTALHPCQRTIQHLFDSQLPGIDDTEQALKVLLDNKLIQKINFQQMSYFDKNPYPHDHIFNLETTELSDYTGNELLGNNQLQLITHESSY